MENEQCWTCDSESFPEAKYEGQTWGCGSCDAEYIVCRLNNGELAWEYTEESFDRELSR